MKGLMGMMGRLGMADMLGKLIRSYRTKRLEPALREQDAFYAMFSNGVRREGRALVAELGGSAASASPRPETASLPPLETVRAWQLERFNEVWADIPFRVPYYVDLMGELPPRFNSWEEFSALMPVLDRATVQLHGDELFDPTEEPDYYRTTGGSSAQPVQIPSWSRERDYCTADMWYGRSWYGVDPGDRLFVMWGHRHLLGSGLSGLANRWIRRTKDALAGYRRFSAYDVSDEAMRRAGDELLDFKPDYVLAYASALDRFARVNRDRSFAHLNLKVAIATAESFPRADSADVIADVLGCPVAMEYGCVETGPLAYQHPDGTYHAFWRHYYLESVPSPDVPGAFELLVTGLHPRCFPLIRYRLGDLIEPVPGGLPGEVPGDLSEEVSIRTRFQSVRGRSDELVRIGESRIHYETFEHVLGRKDWLKGYQIVVGDEVRLRFASTREPAEREVDELRGEMNRLSPALRELRLERVDELDRTVAGKLCHVVREGENRPCPYPQNVQRTGTLI